MGDARPSLAKVVGDDVATQADAMEKALSRVSDEVADVAKGADVVEEAAAPARSFLSPEEIQGVGFSEEVSRAFANEFVATKRIDEAKAAGRVSGTLSGDAVLQDLQKTKRGAGMRASAVYKEAGVTRDEIRAALKEAGLPIAPEKAVAAAPATRLGLPEAGSRVSTSRGEGEVVERLSDAPNGSPRYSVLFDGDEKPRIAQGASVKHIESSPDP